MMIPLENLSQLLEIDHLSANKPLVIFKHSTRCSISSAALNRFRNAYRETDRDTLPVYYLDLLNHRDISNAISSHYHIYHESPQCLLIKDGKCIYHASHLEIDLEEMKTFL